MREELKDLIDDGPIEEDGDDSDTSQRSKKRKRSDDDFDDRLEDDDYDLIEENLGVKVDRVSTLYIFPSVNCELIIFVYIFRNVLNVCKKLLMKSRKKKQSRRKRGMQLPMNCSKDLVTLVFFNKFS